MSAKITKVKGSVKIKNSNTQNIKSVNSGTTIDNDDLLIIEKDSSVEFICGNGVKGSKSTEGKYGLSDICPNEGFQLDNDLLLKSYLNNNNNNNKVES